MRLLALICILSLTICIGWTKCEDLYSSMQEMKTLVNSQNKIVNYLQEYINIENEKIEKAKQSLKDFQDLQQASNPDPEKFISNPVNAFLLIKTLTKDLDIIINTLDTTTTFEKMKKIIKGKFVLPTIDDYVGSITALHRLQDTYFLPTANISRGHIDNFNATRSLTTYEAFELGRVAYTNGDYYNCVKWMNQALSLYSMTSDEAFNSIEDLTLILDYLAYATGKQGNFKRAAKLIRKILSLDPEHRVKKNLAFYEKHSDDDQEDIEFERSSGSEFDDRYKSLCRCDETKLKVKNQHLLKCRYIHYHPALMIAPVKEELVHFDPPVWIYYDVITDKQIESFKKTSLEHLSRAIVRNPATGVYETATYRVSKSGWLEDHQHEMFPKMTKLVESITNMSLDTAESWQIGNYGIGGQYDPHYDFSRTEDGFEDDGNRAATWLYYLEVPELGGGTAFPLLNIKIQPVRRSAVFWYNCFPGGEGDYRTKHGACPVLIGSKWVSNKWIHQHGQEFTRKCGMKRISNRYIEGRSQFNY